MADFNVRSDSVDVEQIMRQIRARIREKRGVDYTEAEVQQLAKVKLEKFLDPRGLRSDLLEQFRRREFTPSPLDFDERRGRSLERVVEYRPNAAQRPSGGAPPQTPAVPGENRPPDAASHAAGPQGADQGGERRRRRRRRRRRPGQTMAEQG